MKLSPALPLIALFAAAMFLACEQGGTATKVQTTAGGYEYQMITDIEGDTPQIGDYVLFFMKQYMDDSLISDSKTQSDDPLEFKWVPAAERKKINHPVVDLFAFMSKGDVAEVIQPIDSMMRKRQPAMKDVGAMRYEVTIDDILNTAEYNAYQEERMKEFKEQEAAVAAKVSETLSRYKAGKLDDLRDDAEGMKYVVLEAGTGPQKKSGEMVQAHYYGVLESDGKMFDNSFKRGRPLDFGLGRGQVIKGWDVGISQLKVGDKAVLFIPYDMAYGAAGSPPNIPEKANLVFYVEVLK